MFNIHLALDILHVIGLGLDMVTCTHIFPDFDDANKRIARCIRAYLSFYREEQDNKLY